MKPRFKIINKKNLHKGFFQMNELSFIHQKYELVLRKTCAHFGKNTVMIHLSRARELSESLSKSEKCAT